MIYDIFYAFQFGCGMDFNKKPELENPRKGANVISRLFFLWTLPLFWKGMKNGLTTDDLTKCLPKDKSDKLTDAMEMCVKLKEHF